MHGKADILQQLDAQHDALGGVLDRVDEAHGTWEGAVGSWSVVNVVQHMAGWLEEMTAALERMARGERPTPEGADYSAVDEWNAGFVEARGAQSLADARAAFEAAHQAFRDAVDALPEERFGEGKTANRLVDGTALHHYQEHAEQLDRYLSGAH